MLETMPARLASLRVDGGASADDLLCQIQADQIGVPVERPELVETTAADAAQARWTEAVGRATRCAHRGEWRFTDIP